MESDMTNIYKMLNWFRVRYRVMSKNTSDLEEMEGLRRKLDNVANKLLLSEDYIIDKGLLYDYGKYATSKDNWFLLDEETKEYFDELREKRVKQKTA
jgi:hypothetical protein